MMKPAPNRHLYNFQEAASILGVTRPDIEKLVQESGLKSVTVPGNHRRILQRDLQDFIRRTGGQEPASWKETPEKLRVLVVEDDEDLLEIVTELLHDETRIDVRAESNAFTAGLQVAGWFPDLILLDFLMPGITGFDLCRQLRGDEKTRDLPVLAMTSLTAEELKREVMASGVSDFIGKPFHSEALLAKVRELLALDPAENLKS